MEWVGGCLEGASGDCAGDGASVGQASAARTGLEAFFSHACANFLWTTRGGCADNAYICPISFGRSGLGLLPAGGPEGLDEGETAKRW